MQKKFIFDKIIYIFPAYLLGEKEEPNSGERAKVQYTQVCTADHNDSARIVLYRIFGKVSQLFTNIHLSIRTIICCNNTHYIFIYSMLFLL